MMRPSMGLPLPMPRGGPMEGSYRFPPQGQVILRGGPGGMARPQMQMTMGPRGPVSGGQMVLGRMPGPPTQQHVLVMQQPQRPGLPPNVNGPPLVRQPIRPGPSGEDHKPSALLFIDLIPYVCRRNADASRFNDSNAWSTSARLLSRTTSTRSRSMYCFCLRNIHTITDHFRLLHILLFLFPVKDIRILTIVVVVVVVVVAMLQRIWFRLVKLNSKKSWNVTKPFLVVPLLELCKTHLPVSIIITDHFLIPSLNPSGDFGQAIETLVTAVSLIKQSKIANDDRCKILISSLQDTLKGIEDKSYGAR